ncbi:MAG TPA: nucleoside deaminase [Kiloniellales bacterium]|nr:nucleoside deaminase [Kiloniellales bacterium]
MAQALHLAETAARLGEVPVGAVVIERGSGRLVTATHNRVEADHDPTAHAEVLALREAAALLRTPRLVNCDLYVTLEPCPMCAQAIAFARIGRLIFGAYDPKGGGVEHGARIYDQATCHHRPEVIGGMRESDCAAMLQKFFRARR